MVRVVQIPCKKVIHTKSEMIILTRSICKYINNDLRSKTIRQKFLEYFINENNHKFVKSSPVVPYCDPTVAFVNAGMNQFKSIFLGTQTPRYKRVANSQKCIRVGGKHNDLNVVGVDGYHHTFFEMLGNWSFGDYFKPEACKLAWNLLTKVYKLPTSRLYVTYFKGDKELEVEEDLETKEIWKELGVSADKILPFGLRDNFWEMGLTGPCGPCTEIHYDHLGTSNRSEFVNKGLHDLTEIWNIVFIEYNRLPDGTIVNLPQKHVDTGLGFERLTSILQNKISNYDTDNFKYLLKAINKNCSNLPKYEGKFGENDWNSLDQSYRTLADHSRMITICLADGVIPEENQKLRRILRKTFLLSETAFKREKGLLKELSNYVVENLGPFYPELEKNISQIHQIIDYEEEVYKSVRESSSKVWQKLTIENPKLLELDVIETPNFIGAYNEIATTRPKEIGSKLAFKLYDTFGIDEDAIAKLSKALNLKFNPQELVRELETAKIRSKESSAYTENKIYSYLLSENIPKTYDTSKYSYSKHNGKYSFEEIETTVLKIFKDEESIDEIKNDHYCSLVLDQTNLYSEAGGQISDRGIITLGTDTFDVTSVENVNGYIVHKGFFRSNGNTLRTNTKGKIRVDDNFRLCCMRNHTCTHLLNAALKKIKGATCQKSSKVTDKYLTFDVAIFGDKLSHKDVEKVEAEVLEVLKKNQPVNVIEVDSQGLLAFDCVTLIPGEVYPESGIRIIEVKNDSFLSREPCCGTHVLDTSDLEDFCIVNIKSLGRSIASISAVTGDRAKLARENGSEIVEEIDSLKVNISDNIDKPELLEMIEFETDFIEIEMKNALESNVKTTNSNKRYIIHYLRSSMMLENVPLQKATKLCPDLPILVLAYADNMVKARCCVPKNLKTEKFNAEKWMKETVAEVFKSRAAPPKGQDGSLVCNMKAKKVHVQEWDPLLKDSLERAEKYIKENL
nr:alanine--tRNA ligase, mitochondrial [Leptinotarsa decemlineata]